MSRYLKRFHETKYMSFLLKLMNYQKIIKSVIKSAVVKDLIANQSTMKNILKLKYNLKEVKSYRI